MRVKEVMTEGVKSCRVEDFLNVPAQLMWDNDCGCIPVLDGSGRVCGIITDRDICIAAYTQGKTLQEIPVVSAMSREVWSCSPSDSLAAAERLMAEKKVRRLPVIDSEGKLAGIISLHDVAREAVRQRECIRRQVGDDEVGRTLAGITIKEQPKKKSEAAPVVAVVTTA